MNLIEIELPHLRPSWISAVTYLSGPIESVSDANDIVRGITNQPNLYSVWSEEVENAVEVLNFIRELALDLPLLFEEPVFYLLGVDATAVLNRQQVACLLACSFYGCFETGNFERPEGVAFNEFNITELFHVNDLAQRKSVACLCYYFFRLHRDGIPEGTIRIHRKIRDLYPDYSSSETRLTCMIVTDDMYPEPSFQAYFSDEYIGGRAMGGGSSHEDITFVVKPELLVSMLFCSKIDLLESFIISGAEQFSNYGGYGHPDSIYGPGGDFFNGVPLHHQDHTPFDDTLNCIKNHLVAIDAIHSETFFRFEESHILRDINKLYCALKDCNSEETDCVHASFATGHWGCGTYDGDKQLKAVQQLIAASESGVNLVYSVGGDYEFQNDLDDFYQYLRTKDIHIGLLYSALVQCNTKRKLFEEIIETLDKYIAET